MSSTPVGRTVSQPDWTSPAWDITEEEFQGSTRIAPDHVFAWRTGGRNFDDYDATRFDLADDLASV